MASIEFLIVGLQKADVELEARVTALEETNGTDSTNGKYCLFRSIGLILYHLAF